MASEERLRDATLTATDFDPRAAEAPPARARAVVVGGGIIGASVALPPRPAGLDRHRRPRAQPGRQRHQLARRGPHDPHPRHPRRRPSSPATAATSTEGLAALSGVDIGYYPNGSLSVARTRRAPDRAALRAHDGAPPRPAGARADARTRSPASRRCSPSTTSPAACSSRTTRRSIRAGPPTRRPRRPSTSACASSRACGVTGFRLDGGRVVAVETDRGAVRVRGRRDRRRALDARPRACSPAPALPLHPAEHYWAQTEPVDGRHARPADRPRPRRLHLRAPLPGRPPRRRVRARRPAAHDRLDPARTSRSASSSRTWSTSRARSPRRACACRRWAEARFAHYLCAPESFTPDGNFLLGETGRGRRALRRRRA